MRRSTKLYLVVGVIVFIAVLVVYWAAGGTA